MQESDQKNAPKNGLFAVGKRKVVFVYVDLSRLKSLTVKLICASINGHQYKFFYGACTPS